MLAMAMAMAMAQLHATVSNNTDAARRARQLASASSQVAAADGEWVGRVVSVMQDISAHSTRFADIVGVIDGIAFQTRILVLNAAVEATGPR
jgi:methyl-accepting chemotaxis protein